MSGVDHVRFYSSKWRSGCLMLSLEAEGLYIRIASFRWDAGVRVPSDRKKAALLLRINYNKYTKVLDELFTAKLVIDNGDGIVIERAEIEYQAAEDAIRDKARRVSKSNGNGTAGTPDQGCEGQASDDPVKDTGQPTPQVTPPLTGLVTPPTASENHQGNQRPSIDKDSREGEQKSEGETRAPASVETLAHGVVVNCETIRHPSFSISIPAIELGIAGRIPRDEVKRHCVSHALQWAAEIDGGKASASVVPGKIANFLVASIMGDMNRTASAELRRSKAATQPAKKTVKQALADREARQAAGVVQ